MTIKMNSEIEPQGKEFSLSDSKEQTTIHISANLLDKVEEVLYFCRKSLPRTKRGKLSKSKLYELIIETVVTDKKLIAKIISELKQA